MKRTIFFLYLIACSFLMLGCRTDDEDIRIIDMYPTKGRFDPGEPVTVILEIENGKNKNAVFDIDFFLHTWSARTKLESFEVELDQNETTEKNYVISIPDTDYRGYMLEASINNRTHATTAIDCSSSWSVFPRYGYLTDYGEKSFETIENTIDDLVKHHITGLQFYDWQHTHHRPLPLDHNDEPLDSWYEISGKRVSFDTIKSLIDLAHDRNMETYAYNLLYGAYENFESDQGDPSWGTYRDRQGLDLDFHPLPQGWQTSSLLLMNPADTFWQAYFTRNMKDVFKHLSFDGWHADQLGFRGNRYDSAGSPINLEEGMESLLSHVHHELGIPIVFNAVDGYGEDIRSPFIQPYREIWSDLRYPDLARIIRAEESSPILAAYLHYGSKDRVRMFNEAAVLLLRASVYANGGSLISLGDQGMLSNEYFPSQNIMLSESTEKRVRAYDSFMVAYQNILRDSISFSDLSIDSKDMNITSGGLGNTVWGFSARHENTEIVHLINLMDNTNDWRDDDMNKRVPPSLTDLSLSIEGGKTYSRVLLISPDRNHGLPTDLSFTQYETKGTHHLDVTIPFLDYWDMLVLIEAS